MPGSCLTKAYPAYSQLAALYNHSTVQYSNATLQASLQHVWLEVAYAVQVRESEMLH